MARVPLDLREAFGRTQDKGEGGDAGCAADHDDGVCAGQSGLESAPQPIALGEAPHEGHLAEPKFQRGGKVWILRPWSRQHLDGHRYLLPLVDPAPHLSHATTSDGAVEHKGTQVNRHDVDPTAPNASMD